MDRRVDNVFIEGDNLDVLPDPRPGSVDLIYIDPPYNTGNDFAYVDSFRADGGGRASRHAAWVAMMRPEARGDARGAGRHRARIFVSIDDNEAAHLRLLLDEVFGEANFLAQIVVNLNPKGRQLGGGFATSHEYLLRLRPRREVTACSTRAARTPSTPHDFRAAPPTTAGPFGTCRCATRTRSSTRSRRRTLHFPVYGDPLTGQVATADFAGAQEVWPVFGDGRPPCGGGRDR